MYYLVKVGRQYQVYSSAVFRAKKRKKGTSSTSTGGAEVDLITTGRDKRKLEIMASQLQNRTTHVTVNLLRIRDFDLKKYKSEEKISPKPSKAKAPTTRRRLFTEATPEKHVEVAETVHSNNQSRLSNSPKNRPSIDKSCDKENVTELVTSKASKKYFEVQILHGGGEGVLTDSVINKIQQSKEELAIKSLELGATAIEPGALNFGSNMMLTSACNESKRDRIPTLLIMPRKSPVQCGTQVQKYEEMTGQGPEQFNEQNSTKTSLESESTAVQINAVTNSTSDVYEVSASMLQQGVSHVSDNLVPEAASNSHLQSNVEVVSVQIGQTKNDDLSTGSSVKAITGNSPQRENVTIEIDNGTIADNHNHTIIGNSSELLAPDERAPLPKNDLLPEPSKHCECQNDAEKFDQSAFFLPSLITENDSDVLKISSTVNVGDTANAKSGSSADITPELLTQSSHQFSEVIPVAVTKLDDLSCELTNNQNLAVDRRLRESSPPSESLLAAGNSPSIIISSEIMCEGKYQTDNVIIDTVNALHESTCKVADDLNHTIDHTSSEESRSEDSGSLVDDDSLSEIEQHNELYDNNDERIDIEQQTLSRETSYAGVSEIDPSNTVELETSQKHVGESGKRRSLSEFAADFPEPATSDVKEPLTLDEIVAQLDDPELQYYASQDAEMIRNSSFSKDFNLDNDSLINSTIIEHNVTSLESVVASSSIEVDENENDPEDESFDISAKEDETIGRDDSSLTGNSSGSINEATTIVNSSCSSIEVSNNSNISQVTGSIDKRSMVVKPKDGKSKKDFCLYCHKMVSAISRHYKMVHSKEDLVKSWVTLPANNPERKYRIGKVRKLGNYVFNTNPKHNTTGEMLVSRLPREERPGVKYKICHLCKGCYSANSIRRHMPKCSGGLLSGGNRDNVVLSNLVEGRVHSAATEELAGVLSRMRTDAVGQTVRYDELLIKFGNALREKYTNQHEEDMVRNRLRTLGRLLLIMKGLSSDITDFQSIYHPALYDTMLKAVNILAGYDANAGEHTTPSLVTSIGTYIGAVGDTLKVESIKQDDDHKEKLINKYLFLHKKQYSIKVNRAALETQTKRHRQNAKPLPSTEDVKKLSDYVTRSREEAYEELNKKYSYANWLQLLKMTLVSIQIFNRKRAGEIERAEIADLKTTEKITEEDHAALFNNLNSEEKELVAKYSRFIIRGKLTRPVAVLLDNDMEKCLSLILKYRNVTKTPSSNPHIFGLPGFVNGIYKYLRSCELMRQFSQECGAKHPERLRGTLLRKHMATNCAASNVNENEIVDIANFMGHAEAIHRSHYRQSVASRDLIKVAKVLQAALTVKEVDNLTNGNGDIGAQGVSNSNFGTTGYTTGDNHDQPGPSGLNQVTKGLPPQKKSRKYVTESSSDESDFEQPPKRRRLLSSEDDCDKTPSSRGLKRPVPKQRTLKGHGGSKKTGKGSKRRWTDEEKAAAFAEFGELIKEGKGPSTSAIRAFLKRNPFIEREEAQIRTWASNEKRKYLKDYGDKG